MLYFTLLIFTASLSSAFLYCIALYLGEELYDDCVEGGTDPMNQQQGGKCSVVVFVVI